MLASAHHAEIVERKARVDGVDNALHALTDGGKLRVVGDDGVVVDDQLDAQLFGHVALDAVDQLMRLEHILPRVQLDVYACKAAAGAVVVDHEVVHAEHLFVRQKFLCDSAHQMLVRRHAEHARVIAADLVGNAVDERLVRRFAEQRRDGIARNAQPRPEDEQRHKKPRPAVAGNACQLRDGVGEKHRRRGDHVVA